MKRQGPLEQLAAVEWSLDAAPEFQAGDTLQRSERWLHAVSDRLESAGVVEAGMLATSQAWVHLSMGGALSRDEDGGNRAYRERVAEVRALQGEVVSGLTTARARLTGRVELFTRIAETAIRAGAEARLLAAPGNQVRAEWLGEMARRMAENPSSATHVARLALALSEVELLSILDRAFRTVFDV